MKRSATAAAATYRVNGDDDEDNADNAERNQSLLIALLVSLVLVKSDLASRHLTRLLLSQFGHSPSR